MKAARMYAAGKSQAEVARKLGVTRQSACRWYWSWEQGGKDALAGSGRAGRRPRLDEEQMRKIERALREGPRAFGYSTELWTLSRLSEVIKKLTGVRYHRGHVWKLMRKLGWSLQRPIKRAKERNEKAVCEWKRKRWPALKKKPAGERRGSCSRMRAASPNGHRCAGRGRHEARRLS